MRQHLRKEGNTEKVPTAVKILLSCYQTLKFSHKGGNDEANDAGDGKGI
jgi:hypothetical protein